MIRTTPHICTLLGLTATAALLSLIQPPVGLAILAWIAYVPFGYACSSTKLDAKHLVYYSLIIGAVYWLINLYWIAPITIAGWIALCIYMAILWPIMAAAVRSFRGYKLPMSISMAVAIVGAERLQGFPLGGFYWRLLAHSQYQNLTLIQISDTFGAGGVSFLIGLFNGLVVDLVITKGSNKRRVAVEFICVMLLVAAALAYGHWRLQQASSTIRPGPVLAAAQSNVPQSVKRTFKASDQILDELIELSRQAAGEQVNLVIWPETTVQAILDDQIWPLLDDESSAQSRYYNQQLRQFCKDYRTYLLVGAYGGRLRQERSGQWTLDRFNSAFLYRPDGSCDPNRYDKIHLVLFGEFLPFRHSIKWLYNLLMRLTPYNYDYSLEPGTKQTIFKLQDLGSRHDYRFGVLICYEDTVPELARGLALGPSGSKAVDWIVNISNDGWFVGFSDQQEVHCTTELIQHLATCVFRAVENRLSVVRSVNTGISCIIDPCGRIIDGGLYPGSLPVRATDRQGVSGWFADTIPIDSRVAPFTVLGQLLDTTCSCILVAGLLIAALQHLRKRKGSKNARA